MARNAPLRIVAACGLGTGTALFLKMTVDDILKKANVDAIVETADASIAQAVSADIVVTAQDLVELVRRNPRVKEIVEITNYGNLPEIREKLLNAVKRLEQS
ncbi:MAG: PTS sugar transporter subunit IIB [Anaerolineae bacterium]|nr:PTS sugar transporter subunit IIB [Chloroflexota bacterium]